MSPHVKTIGITAMSDRPKEYDEEIKRIAGALVGELNHSNQGAKLRADALKLAGGGYTVDEILFAAACAAVDNQGPHAGGIMDNWGPDEMDEQVRRYMAALPARPAEQRTMEAMAERYGADTHNAVGRVMAALIDDGHLRSLMEQGITEGLKSALNTDTTLDVTQTALNRAVDAITPKEREKFHERKPAEIARLVNEQVAALKAEFGLGKA